MLGHLWLSPDVDVAKKAKHPQKSQNHPSYHEKVQFTVRNTAAQEMAADGAAGAQVQESAEQEVSCRQAQQKMGHGHLLHPHQARRTVSVHDPRSLRQLHCGLQNRNGTNSESGSGYHSSCYEASKKEGR